MHAVRLLHDRARRALPGIHRVRLRSLFDVVVSLLDGQRLWLTALGRAMRGKAQEKHRIKRVDRLLGNRKLAGERIELYRWLSGLMLAQCANPCIVVDWSDIDPGKKLFLLRAAVAVGGRALSVYEEVHGRYNHRRDLERFLDNLQRVLPAGCRPVIVTDAGFRSPWFRAVDKRGWFYVGRVLNRDYVRFDDCEQWVPSNSLHARATSRPQTLGALWIPRYKPMRTYAYLYRKPRRHRVRLTAKGKRRRDGPSLKGEQRERAPWLLLSNLAPGAGVSERVVAMYRARMSIEEGFRDLKAHRHGFALRQNIGRDPQRVANLLLVAAIASVCAWLTGLVGQARSLDRPLQANTERRRTVLSTFFIGLRLLKHRLHLNKSDVSAALRRLNDSVLRLPLEGA